ncbi:MAG: cupin domain-containing protein [Gammaproteobacteria bacterium]|nr:cupin domain-containing protein [Gammaproteobacteria bacterium]
MKINWTNISQQDFLENYWQKQPIVLKHAIPNFIDVISADELAGIAMEEFIDSRLISNSNNQWQVSHGPFEHFEDLPETNWSLLVQGVDNFFASVADLKSLVDFLPKWRIDDVMISFSTKDAGVGAHLDQYDVFIIQGHGKRRWQAGSVDQNLKQSEVSKDLLQLDGFEAIIDEVLEPGDIIYIPPFSPHKGVTIEPCLNYSIGFRAPSAKELMSEFADFALDHDLGNKRYQTNDYYVNPGKLNSSAGSNTSSLLSSNETQALKQMLHSLIDSEDVFDHFINEHLTKPTRELDINEQAITVDELIQTLEQPDTVIRKTLGLRSSSLTTGENILFFCHGEEFLCHPQQIEFIKILENNDKLTEKDLKSFEYWLENIQLVTRLINYGYWFIDNKDNDNGLQDTQG